MKPTTTPARSSESKPHISHLLPTSSATPSSTSTQSLASSLGPPASFSTSTQSTQVVSPTQTDIASQISSCSQCPTSVSSASTVHPHHSASNYDPAVARLKVSKEVIKELQKLVDHPPKSQTTSADPDAQTRGMKIRFYASLLVMITFGLAGAFLQKYAYTWLGQIGTLLLAAFIWQWYAVYGSGMTRQRRTYFDEKNVLETYKIYDREFGHLFQKEPDTPANCCPPPPKLGDSTTAESDPVQAVANDLLAQYKAPPKEKAQFQKDLQDHYGGMYDNIRRVNDELEVVLKARKANAEADGRMPKNGETEEAPLVAFDPLVPHTKPGPLVPANIPLPGQKNNSYGEKK